MTTTALAHAPHTVFRRTEDLTADAPPEARGIRRDGVRLLVAAASQDGGPSVEHTSFDRIGEHLRPGDLLLVNDSATVVGEVDGLLVGRGTVVVHVATELNDGSWVLELRVAPDAARPVLDAVEGDVVEFTGRSRRGRSGPRLRLEAPYPEPGSSPTGRGNRLWRARELGGPALTPWLVRHGRPIAYGYLRGRYPIGDYQTVFGHLPGSAEMASAGRPFTTGLVTRLVSSGVLVAPVTLHTGLSSQEAGEAPQPERFAVSATTAALVNHVRAHHGRVVAVGTTATRAIESAASADGVVRAAAGWTDLVISPSRPAHVVDGLVTGWHDPEASHLLLVESVAGPALTQRAYDEAVAHRYAWHEFGDAGLFLRG
ncbi:queuosine biosynthesis protein [Intrasporangium oryzae NRRL B-24470]|uniref:Queuosine biosynthesis protein n=1 Tax=Intrasporangium oryzae NRRL B-24470 TaxID=1386089 RepID=W9G6Y9_9MICO|nr:S-adenosylmethionine:tRNA ribosyltransferase-isomerase [Intrasporangium oryzae]EWT00573.1 queuosine biosynthesis protein [Intrasporangium oryzae NRRL B-24470]